MRLSSKLLASALLLSLAAASPLHAVEYPLVTGTSPGPVLVGGSGRVLILSDKGSTLWEYPAGLVHDVWMLPKGNILFADGDSVTEVTRSQKVVFQYKSPIPRGGGTYSCQRLANGNTVIGENSTGKVLEVDSKGKIVFSLQTHPSKVGEHHNMRMVRKLKNGNYLVCHSGAHVVKEYAPDGKVVWESAQPALTFAAIRTARGTTFVSSLNQIIEYDKDGKKIWECSTKDFGDTKVTNMTGMHLLENGNILVGVYAAYDQKGRGCSLLEITREKKVLWTFANPRADQSMMGAELLTEDRTPLPEPCMR